MLDAGVELVLDSIAPDDLDKVTPLAHIRVRDVVRLASRAEGFPITTGALYNIWASQREYQVDLMLHILREGSDPGAQPILKLAVELFARRVPVEEAFARLADESFRLDIESNVGRATTAFTAFAAVPEIRQALLAAHATRLNGGRALYPLLLDYAGLRMREPYTLDQLMTVIGALSDGLQQTRSYVSEVFEVPEGHLSLFAQSASAIFYRFCEPVPATEAKPTPASG